MKNVELRTRLWRGYLLIIKNKQKVSFPRRRESSESILFFD